MNHRSPGHSVNGDDDEYTQNNVGIQIDSLKSGGTRLKIFKEGNFVSNIILSHLLHG